MEDQYLEGRGMAYRTNGIDPNRQTLLFVHGLSGSASAWLAYEKKYTDTYNVLTYDLRGHGKSRRPRVYAEYAFTHFADDIEALLSHLAVERCTIISHSFGVQVALQYLRAYPARITHTVFLAPMYGIRRLWLAKATHWLWDVACFFAPRGYGGGRLDYTRFPHTPDWDLRRIAADVRNTGAWQYLCCLRQAYAASDTPIDIHVPTLVVHGSEDSFVPLAHALELCHKVPGATLVEIADANHILVLNNPTEVIQALNDFLQASNS